MRHAYDAAGNEIEVADLDLLGQLNLHEEGFSYLRRLHDAHGNVLETSWFDHETRPTPVVQGYARLTAAYNEYGDRVHFYGQDGSIVLAGRRLFLVHYPHYAKAMALTGQYDVVCNGHEHRAVIERIRNVMGTDTLRIDPGTVGGVSAPATYAFGDLATLEFSIRPVTP